MSCGKCATRSASRCPDLRNRRAEQHSCQTDESEGVGAFVEAMAKQKHKLKAEVEKLMPFVRNSQ
jgi:hypothetical protein